MKTYNILVEFNKEKECGELIKSNVIPNSFTDDILFKVPTNSEESMVSYVCQQDTIQEAEKEAIEYIEEMEHQKVQSLTEYMEDRLQSEADAYYQDNLHI